MKRKAPKSIFDQLESKGEEFLLWDPVTKSYLDGGERVADPAKAARYPRWLVAQTLEVSYNTLRAADLEGKVIRAPHG